MPRRTTATLTSCCNIPSRRKGQCHRWCRINDNTSPRCKWKGCAGCDACCPPEWTPGPNPEGSIPEGCYPEGNGPFAPPARVEGSNPTGPNPEGTNPEGTNPEGTDPGVEHTGAKMTLMANAGHAAQGLVKDASPLRRKESRGGTLLA